jgi:polyhydroxyalkanoate synthesis regulator protein
MNSFTQAQKEWRKASNPMSLFEAQARRNMALFEQAMQMFVPPTGQADPDPGARGASPGQTPGPAAGPANPFAGYQAEALAAMQQQMDAFRKQLAELSGKE